MAPATCQALNVSDQTRCRDEATAADDTFCKFHARQAYGLYRGYKRRGKALEALEASPPAYLANSRANIRNETFAGVDDEKTLDELHRFLFKKYSLLDRVIRARRIHHSRFYPLSLDYGHKAYIDKLVNDRTVTPRALERLGKRTAKVLHARQDWFDWVRQQHDDEESTRENESEIVKKEAKLFARHWKEVQVRLAKTKRDEDLRRQEAFLDEAYQARLADMSADEAQDEWDPIEDAVEDERDSFVDLMKHLLWLIDLDDVSGADAPPATPSAADQPSHAEKGKENVDPTKTMTNNARKRAKAKAKALNEPRGPVSEDDVVRVEVNESRQEMRDRLLKGVRFRPSEGVKGEMIGGTIDAPLQTIGRIAPMPPDEVDPILGEVSEIKLYLFCRLLLSQAPLLPAALRADSVESFLADPEISIPDLRDLCLKVEQPSLQQIRDACADFFRGNSSEADAQSTAKTTTEVDHASDKPYRLKHRGLPSKWRSKHEEEADMAHEALSALKEEAHTLVDFGSLESGALSKNLVRVSVCGKTIWNYPSNSAMPREGWLHFSIIARGCRLFDAISLCRNWDEFWELNGLAIFKFFPAAGWDQWVGDRLRQQLLQLGIIPYLQFDTAEEMTVDHKAGGREQGPSIHAMWQFRNVLGVHVARNSVVSRRWVQYLAMKSADVVLLVRDGKTGELLVTAEEEELWLARERVGYGRASGNDWIVRKKVGSDLFEQISGKEREWQFGFTDYYDVIIWDLLPGRPYAALYATVHDLMVKAHRCAVGMDMYNPMESVLKTIHQERDSGRTRTVKPGEMSVWDDLHHQGSKFMFWDMNGKRSPSGQRAESQAAPNFFYSEVDASEDAVLFPDETQGNVSTRITDRTDHLTTRLERTGPDWKRFVNGLDSDDESDDYDDPFGEEKKKEITASRMGTLALHEPNQEEDSGMETSGDDTSLAKIGDDCTCEHCTAGHTELCEQLEDENSDDDDAPCIYDTADGDPETMRIAMAFEDLKPDQGYGDDPETDFWEFLDREKAKIFKQCWTAAISDTEERAKYEAVNTLIKGMSKHDLPKSDKQSCCWILIWLRVHFAHHRIVWKDIVRAWLGMAPFFNGTKEGTMPLLLREIADNDGRSKSLRPYNRTFRSNVLLPAKFWKEADELNERRAEARRQRAPFYNREGDAVMRPVIAHWFKAGVICPAHVPDAPGDCIVIHEEGKERPELFMDYRSIRSHWPDIRADMKAITDPYSVDILEKARAFRRGKPDARFALLRVWSHSHFYPLMLGHDNRINSSFFDEVARSWSWKFVPRDMPGSEWSMQKGVDMRIDPFRKQFGKNVVVKRDMVLVMEQNEEDLKQLAVAVCYAIQTKPWRMDVDLFKSFVNVPLSFLECLDKAWVE